MEKTYYVYRHIRLDKNEVFYVGIGTCYYRNNQTAHKSVYRRAYKTCTRSTFWKNVLNKTEIRVEIIYESLSLKEIQDKEIFFIALYGRKNLKTGTLVNLTDGGEKNNGFIPEFSHMQKASIASLVSKCQDYYQYSLDGTFIKSWNFQKEEDRNNTKVFKKSINKCAKLLEKNKLSTVQNYFFSREKYEKNTVLNFYYKRNNISITIK